MRDDRHPVSQALDAPAQPVRTLLPLSALIGFAIRTGQLDPGEDDGNLRPLPGSYEFHALAEVDGEPFQLVHQRFPELARAVLEPCLDPGCDGAPGWGTRRDEHDVERARRTVWDLIRHLRRDHQWSRAMLAERLCGRAALAVNAEAHLTEQRERLRRA